MKKHFYGGQAVIEGVMIRGMKNCVVAVRNKNQEIIINQIKLPSFTNSYFKKIPFIRGLFILVEMMVIGFRALSKSSEIIDQTEENNLSNLEKFFSYLFSTFFLLFVLSVFLLLPLFLSDRIIFVEDNFIINNIIEGLVRLVFFIAYVYLIGLNKDIKRVFAYHGAEHKTIAAYEDNLELNSNSIDKIQKYNKEHPRCGTSFIMTVILVSIILHVFIPREPLLLLYSSRLFLFPFIAGIAYELIRFSSVTSENPFSRLLSYPNILMQKLTTAEPDKEMVEVAIEAINESIRLDNLN
ncbi:MAG: hypothetical protein CBD90_04070 [Chloroflexi bacterium TMED230]|nr:MAG: hypothetical protein CBD90_04070 [Chloroflexi bacterium TMED230]|tara:strand:- start:4542 stop:5429 length:888 start_codon:yes stop_codon:yes gene_type:complete